jgi:hypothetical protein
MVEISGESKTGTQLGIGIGAPQPPRIGNPTLYLAWIIIGLAAVLVSTWFVDEVGTLAYSKGFSKPFYILGRRIHHSCIYLIVPSVYAVLLVLFFLGYVHIVRASLWTNITYAAMITSLAMGVDFLGDRYWPRIRKNAILHHEWIYTVLPAYVFTYVIHITL